jgi:hypothetical protein
VKGGSYLSNNELSLTDKLVNATIKENLLREYNENSILRGLIQIIPYASMIDTVLTSAYNNILVERSRTFFEELGAGNIELTQEIIESEDFLHAYFATYKAAIYSKQREKIRFLARLLKNGLTTSLLNKADEYDDYLQILDELSIREITILFILSEYEKKNPIKDNETEVNRTSRYWSDFIKETTNLLHINENELKGILSRISRSGCFVEITGTFWNYTGGQGLLTDVYYKLMDLIELKSEDLIYYRKM